jgi:exodeoxyribonuclease VII small subunit
LRACAALRSRIVLIKDPAKGRSAPQFARKWRRNVLKRLIPRPKTARALERVVTEADTDIAAMPFETALAELEGIVDKLEKGAVSLDDSVRLYERGEALKKRCDELLKNAEMRIERITLAGDGKPKGLTPLDGE